MVDHSKEVFISNHGNNRSSLTEQMLLDSIVGKDADVVEVSMDGTPAASNSETLYGLLVLKLIVPWLYVFPLIERLEEDVRILASFCHLVHFNVLI